MSLPCGRCFVAIDGSTRACARPAEHRGICSGIQFSIDIGERQPMTAEEIGATDAATLLHRLAIEAGEPWVA